MLNVAAVTTCFIALCGLLALPGSSLLTASRHYPALVQILSYFTGGKVGTLTDRRGAMTSMIVRADAIANYATMPIIVLIDHPTASYAEVFAGILHNKGRARLVGQTTAVAQAWDDINGAHDPVIQAAVDALLQGK